LGALSLEAKRIDMVLTDLVERHLGHDPSDVVGPLRLPVRAQEQNLRILDAGAVVARKVWLGDRSPHFFTRGERVVVEVLCPSRV
jgi:hypothetical protein